MHIRLNRLRRVSCQYAQLPVEQLSDEQLLVRQTKNRQMIGVVGMMMLLVVAMSFVSKQYLLTTTTAGMIPALDEYIKKGKAITKQLRKRNLR